MAGAGVWLVYSVGVLLALSLALLLRKTVLRGEDAPFVMELPVYRLPTLRSLALKMTQRAGLYLGKAGTTILAISILLWAAMTFPKPPTYRVDAEVQTAAARAAPHRLTRAEIEARRAAERLVYSLAGRTGRALEPLFAPLGFDWRIVTAMIGAFGAKEVFVAQLGIVYSMGAGANDSGGLRAKIARDYSPLVGLSTMLFLLVATPCMATVAATRKESGRWRWALLQFVGLTVIAYVLSLFVYQLGRLVT